MKRHVRLCLLFSLGLLVSVSHRALSQSLQVNGNLSVVGHINTCVTGPTGTTGNAYACTLDKPFVAPPLKACFSFLADVVNTGSATIAFSSTGGTPFGAIPITKVQGGTHTPLVAGDIQAGSFVTVCYDGTSMQCQNCTGTVNSGLVNLATGVTGRLPYANLPAPSTSALILGRGATTGDWQEITLGTNLSMAGTTLNATGGSGSTGISGATTNGLLIATSATTATSLAGATNGQIPIGSTGGAPVLGTIAGTANQIVVTNAAGGITLALATNATLPGTTTGTFSGTLAGNASTATALAANGANCGAGQLPRGVDASGAAEGCAPVSLTAEVSGRLPYANLPAPSTPALLLGRGTTAGDWQEVTLGTNLSMSGTTLNAAGGGSPAGSPAQAQYNNSGAFGGSSGLTLTPTTMSSWQQRSTTLSASATLGANDGPLVACTGGSAGITATLPSAATTTQGHWRLVKVDSGAGGCALAPGGSDTLNTVAGSRVATVQNAYIEVERVSSTNWSATMGQTAVNLATDVTGILPQANGGLGNASGQVPFTNVTGTATAAQLPPLNMQTSGLNSSQGVCTDGTGKLLSSGAACGAGGGGGSPGGSAGQGQYNLGGTAFGGSSGLTLTGTAISSWAQRITTLSASATLSTADGPIVACTSGTGTVTATLPVASTTLQGHWRLVKIDSGTGTCVLAAQGADMLNGTAGGSMTASTRWSYVEVEQLSTTSWNGTIGLQTVNLATDITGRLPYANLTAPSTSSLLLGRGGTTGDWQEITLGTNLSMSGTTLNATGGAGGGGNTVSAKATAYTIVAGDFTALTIFTVASGTPFNLTLPATAPTAGTYIQVLNYSSGLVTIVRNGKNINGAALNLLVPGGTTTQPAQAYVVSDGTNYFGFVDRVQPAINTFATATSMTPDLSLGEMQWMPNTAAAGTFTVNAPINGTPVGGQRLTIRLKSTNVQTFAWNAIYRGGTMPCPTASTGGGKNDYIGLLYHEVDAKWDCVSFASGY